MKWALVIAFLTTSPDGSSVDVMDRWVLPGFESDVACYATMSTGSSVLIDDYKLRHPEIADLSTSVRCEPVLE